MSTKKLTAIVAEDEKLMRERIVGMLGLAWPELDIIAVAKNGVEAIEAWKKHRSSVLFLDIRMPGKTGLEVAAELSSEPDAPQFVFVTAYDEYAIKAFDNGATDYLLKPVEAERLNATVARLKKQFNAENAGVHTAPDLTGLLATLLNRGDGFAGAAPQAAPKLKWLRASLGNQTRLININDVVYFQSDTKYTRIVTLTGDALVRTPLKELLEGLDESEFWQIHRGTIVNANLIERVVREGPEKLILHLKVGTEKLAVSRQFFHLFKQT